MSEFRRVGIIASEEQLTDLINVSPNLTAARVGMFYSDMITLQGWGNSRRCTLSPQPTGSQRQVFLLCGQAQALHCGFRSEWSNSEGQRSFKGFCDSQLTSRCLSPDSKLQLFWGWWTHHSRRQPAKHRWRLQGTSGQGKCWRRLLTFISVCFCTLWRIKSLFQYRLATTGKSCSTALAYIQSLCGNNGILNHSDSFSAWFLSFHGSAWIRLNSNKETVANNEDVPWCLPWFYVFLIKPRIDPYSWLVLNVIAQCGRCLLSEPRIYRLGPGVWTLLVHCQDKIFKMWNSRTFRAF